MKNRTLVAWIGATDLASMGKDVGGQVKLQVEKSIKRQIRDADDGGPIKTLLKNEAFDSIHLLCTCLLYTSPSPRDATLSRMPSSA